MKRDKMVVKPVRKKSVNKSNKIFETSDEKIIKNVSESEILEMLAKIAYELYEKRGGKDGYEQQDWFEAEKIVKLKNNLNTK